MNDNPKPHRSDQGGSRPDFSIAAFIASLCLLTFGYGVAVQRYQIFPYGFIQSAADAWGALNNRDDATLMSGATLGDTNTPPRPTITTLSPQAGREAVLVTGGPFQNMERCPRFGCFAWVMDRSGAILHSWEVDLDQLTSGMEDFGAGYAPTEAPENVYPIGIALTSDGGLVAALHGRNLYPYEVGLVRIDRDGRILWKHFDHAHHYISVAADGRIFTPYMRMGEDVTHFGRTAIETRCADGRVFEEGARIYAPDGTVEREFPMLDALQNADYPGLFYGLRDGCDPFHVNSVDFATPQVARRLRGVNPGDLLLSVREPSAIVLLDRETGALKRIVIGRTAAQHSAVFAPDGSVLAFDNQGGDRALGGSRVVRINLDTGATQTVFPRAEAQTHGPFFAEERGRIDLSGDGRRALVASGVTGEIIEIDLATGAPLWRMHKSFDISAYLDSHHRRTSVRNADFYAYGAYYVDDASLFPPQR